EPARRRGAPADRGRRRPRGGGDAGRADRRPDERGPSGGRGVRRAARRVRRDGAAPRQAAVTPDPFAPAALGPLRLRNRIIKAATFEGMTRDGLVSDELIDFHRTVAAGGVAMTTVAYL